MIKERITQEPNMDSMHVHRYWRWQGGEILDLGNLVVERTSTFEEGNGNRKRTWVRFRLWYLEDYKGQVQRRKPTVVETPPCLRGHVIPADCVPELVTVEYTLTQY